MNKTNNVENVKETVTRIFKDMFLIDVQYYDSNLVYVRKLGGMSQENFERLAHVGLKIRYINPIQIPGKDGKIRAGLQMSLELTH